MNVSNPGFVLSATSCEYDGASSNVALKRLNTNETRLESFHRNPSNMNIDFKIQDVTAGK